MNYWEIGYVTFGVITFLLLFAATAKAADNSSTDRALVMTLGLVLCVLLALVWPVALVGAQFVAKGKRS